MLNIQKNTKLAPHTTFRIGGPADFFVEIKNPDELVEAVLWAKEKKIKYFILGGGSNILFSDDGYRGLVIKIASKRVELVKNNLIIADAGVNLSQLVKFSTDNNLSGLEWAAGIYGTLGGAIFGNAGANGGCMADIVEEVEIFDGKKIKIFKNKNLDFKYRFSSIKKGSVIVSAKLKLKKGDKQTSEKLIKKYLKERSEKQPKGFCAGSIFKNPKSKKYISAGWLIEQCGLKGLKIGQAQISEQHANFIINLGGAKASDVLGLIEKVKKEVEGKFGVKLREELNIIG
ncbi:MAG: UDP-N-acetylmuramate dehydrogenase [bacterium]